MSCSVEFLPILLSLMAALLFATGIQLARLGLEHTDTPAATLTQIGAATMIYWVAAPVFVEARYWLSPAVFLLAAIGLFRPFLSASLSLVGTRLLGPTISSTLSSTAPLFGVALGYLALGETLTAPVLIGAGGIHGLRAFFLAVARLTRVSRAGHQPQGRAGRCAGGAQRGDHRVQILTWRLVFINQTGW